MAKDVSDGKRTRMKMMLREELMQGGEDKTEGERQIVDEMAFISL
jgi:hypothetical protein